MSANAPEVKTKKVPDRLICEACGAEFSCGVNVGECWCFAVEVKTETLTDLRKVFNNCLCEKCLNKYGKKEK